ncbi:MAG: hypothetical protein ACYDCN_14535, partial [Bacteroidia bacterium]
MTYIIYLFALLADICAIMFTTHTFLTSKLANSSAKPRRLDAEREHSSREPAHSYEEPAHSYEEPA